MLFMRHLSLIRQSPVSTASHVLTALQRQQQHAMIVPLRSLRSLSTRNVARWIWDHRPPKKWVIGAAILTPVAAVIQGAILLNDFRERHSDAPTPVTPSRGVVVAVSHETADDKTLLGPATKLGKLVVQSVASTAALLEQRSQQPPLRILVIGDSLAAGVGVSRGASPVLPESIARTLSQRLGGRPVYWTCIGTPGASAARIVHDIETYNETLLVRQPTIPTEILVTESWIQGIQKQWKSLKARRDRVRDWWTKVGRPKSGIENDDESYAKEETNDAQTAPRILKWWRGIKYRAQSFREAWRDPDMGNPSTSQESNETTDGDEESIAVDPFQLWQQWRQRLQRRSSLQKPEIVGQFDVAVVLTGLNDLKEAVLPFMFKGDNSSDNDQYSSNKNKSLMSELERVLQALQQKMALALDRSAQKDESDSVSYTLDDDSKNVEEELLQSLRENESRLALTKKPTRRRPLVVFPALPVSPLPIFHSQPLRWFALPLFRRIDNYKREVARRFPGEVLFVESPSDDVFAQIEQGKGRLWNERRREQVLLRLTDITQRARERVEGVMRQHYEKWAKTIGMKDPHSYNRHTPEDAQHSSELDDYHRPGSSLISVDGVHPNDEGYEFWGRHIALAILNEWEAQDRQTEKYSG